ncbi:DUF4136 domain-containing protein [Aliiglaciecola lipolytica]|uniref:DUF4136 domain-containing protein n=1 Tax=Aliiglaciecola lipolytica E3 TaxID=1127673 RepID=K6YCB0_9ALTE|nr:DUF4136 domain-containing protein [Aliiglaciecola lipolytica]GAC15807.1 hypothetical protein GLIP_3190 [Aliiglaciecola lipolytica E3]
MLSKVTNAHLNATRIFILVTGLLVISACSSNNIVMDTDQNTNFTKIKSYSVMSRNTDDTLSAERLISQVSQFLQSNNKLVGDSGFTDAVIELDHYINYRDNDSSFSIGLGTGSFGRSGGVSVGGGVSVPIGSDQIPIAVVSMKVLVEGRLVWSATNSHDFKTDNASSMAKAQQEATSELLQRLPLERDSS